MVDPKAFRPPDPFPALGITERNMMAERHLLQAEDAVVAGESHIERQKKIIREMEAKGQDVALARELLDTFLALQHEHVAHRDRLRAELGR
jgi:hypothetical protein